MTEEDDEDQRYASEEQRENFKAQAIGKYAANLAIREIEGEDFFDVEGLARPWQK